MSTDDWRTEYEARRIVEEAPARDNLRKACALLRRLGVHVVRLEYDGEDGCGGVHGAAFEPEPAAGVPTGVGDVLIDVAYWLLPPGWELDAGSFGSLTIDLATGQVRRDHQRRVHSTVQSTDLLGL